MKLWRHVDARLRRALVALTWMIVGISAGYVTLTVVLTLLSRNDFFGGRLTLLIMAVLFPILLVMLVSVVNYIRYRLTAKYGVYLPNRKADGILSAVSVLGFLITLLCTAGTALSDAWNLHPMMQSLCVYAVLLSFPIGVLALLTNLAVQMILGFRNKRRDRE